MDTTGKLLNLAELFTITLRDGTIYRFTSFGQNITFDGNVYTARAVNRTTVTKDSDLSVGDSIVTFPNDESIATKEQIWDGFFDDSEMIIIWIKRDDHNEWKQSFRGEAADISMNLPAFSVPFNNEMNTFSKFIPVRAYTEACGYVMYSTECTLSRADYLEATTVSNTFTNTTTKFSVAGISGFDSDYFDLGMVEFTSGQNVGAIRWIKSGTNPDSIEVFDELQYIPANGDSIELLPHCRKTYSVCNGVFSNGINFGGHEDIPDPTEVF